jgi:D-alanyl-D-alanine carboxypeptidase/D-alanyl-D-alanine-endopeptidase (penicillin-binding protein 4)
VVTNHLRGTALASLAMLNAFTLGAGVAVAVLLPGQLARWQIPRVTAAPLALPRKALTPAGSRGPAPTRGGLSAVLGSLVSSSSLGHHVGAIVTDLSSGSVLFSRQPTGLFTPASSAKLVTAVAALSVLGPGRRFTTRVVAGASPGSVVLVGGGDPTLAAGTPPKSDYPQPATLASLATSTARWLRAHSERTVRLGYDTSLFSGPGMAPGWTTSDINTGNVTPVTPLEVDQGRLTPTGRPQDADIMSNFHARSFTPTADAVTAFTALLRGDGIRVAGHPAAAAAPRHARAVAAVRSPPLSAIAGQMLRESNNVIAENLARRVALAKGQPATFAGAAAAVTSALRQLGVPSAIHLVDGSGLSVRDRISPQTLVSVVRLAARSRKSLRAVTAALPVAGFSGTLAPGGSVFGSFGPAALGVVRAKTGNLSKVASLTGFVDDASGHLLAFAFMADQLRAKQLIGAADQIDSMATALAACGCR